MAKRLLIIPLLIAGMCLNHKICTAADFSIDQSTNYNCSSPEKCVVLSNISITNNTNEVFASNYILDTGLKDISKINALDYKKTAILTEITQTNGQNSINVKFEKPILGKGSVTNFSISYETKEIIKHIGKIWEVSIPKIGKTEEINNIKITVSVPNDFGPLMYASPQPDNKEEADGTIVYGFNTPTDGVNIVFGEYQLFNFEIYYYLKNDNEILSQTFEVPFPPNVKDTQKVFITDISEKPVSLRIDTNGNYIAEYKLGPKQTRKVELYGLIQVFNREIDPSKGGGFNDIQKSLLDKYTEPQKYWESKSEDIVKIAGSLLNREKTVSENAKEAYIYVTSHLKYSVERTRRNYLERFGAERSLQNPQDAVCMEFTDLTISLLRAMGIPAREINGYAYSEDLSKKPFSVFYDNNKDLLHSWVEFYDPKYGWVEIDPTWGQTSGLDYFSKVDVNHIILVIKDNPLYPLPPGVYKDSNSNKKSVVVTLGNENLLKGDLKSIDTLINKKGKLNFGYVSIIVFLTVPALYMIFLVLKGILGDPRK